MKEFVLKKRLMGSLFTMGIVSSNETSAHELLQLGIKEVECIENMLSEFLPYSETTKINNFSASNPVVVSKDCFDLLSRSLSISKLTKGDFDITTSPLKKIYKFTNKNYTPPEKNFVEEILKSVGYGKIQLDPAKKSVALTHTKTKISFAAIGKGYASDRVKKIWIENGVISGYINASGDLNTFGQRADGSPWKVGISNPDNRHETLFFASLNNCSVATSGDYEQHFMYKNTRFSHTINPHTGIPLTGLKSVTVFSPSAELSDALATAVYVKGVERGISFINQLPHTHCLLIDDKNDIVYSKKMKYEEITL